jgi:hypothetical protein
MADVPANAANTRNPYLLFLFKAIVVVVALYVLLSTLLDTAVESLRSAVANSKIAENAIGRVLGDPVLRTRIRRVLTTNPASHFQASRTFEEAGDLQSAIVEMELAVGLLELHSSDRQAKERYARRLQQLNDKAQRK